MFWSAGCHISSMPTAAQRLIETLAEDMPDLLRQIKGQKRRASAGPSHQEPSN